MSKISCGCAAFGLHIEPESHSAESETASPSLDRKRSKAGGTSVSFVYDGVCVLWLYGSDKANKKCWSQTVLLQLSTVFLVKSNI